MKLYQYDHCPFCIRVRMILGRYRPDCEIITLAYDDDQTPRALIGKKMLPILIKDDGTAMAESLDIITYLQTLDNVPQIDPTPLPMAIKNTMKPLGDQLGLLTKPRVIHLPINDFSQPSAIRYYENKLMRQKGLNFNDCIEKTPCLIAAVEPILNRVAEQMGSQHYVYQHLTMADIILFSRLRNLSIISALTIPTTLQAYLSYQAQQAALTLFTPDQANNV